MSTIKTWSDFFKTHAFVETHYVSDSEGTYAVYEFGEHRLDYYWGDEGETWYYKFKGESVIGFVATPRNVHNAILGIKEEPETVAPVSTVVKRISNDSSIAQLDNDLPF